MASNDNDNTSATEPLPPCRLLFRSKDGVELFTLPSDREAESTIVKQENREFLFKGVTSFQCIHPDGSCAFVHRPEIGIFKLDLVSKSITTTSDDGASPFLKDTAKVQIMDISPKGTYLLTWERPKEGETPNLLVWSSATGDVVAGFRQKVLKKEAWPYVQWTVDEQFAFVMGTNEVRVYPITSFAKDAETRFIDKLRIQGITSMSVPSGSNGSVSLGKIYFTSFSPKTNDKPARACLYEYPPKEKAPKGNYPALLTKSLYQAEEMKVHWSPKGDSALIALQTTVDTSGQSYYGSTSLFLMSPSQSDTIAVPLPQEGPVLDVAWMPNPTKPPCFVVAAGKMPSMTSLHHGNNGKANFLFGNAHRNTIAWAPHGRFVCLAGFGNLAGGMTFWDRNKCKQIPPAEPLTASCTVGYGWSPDSRMFSVSTTSPRMNVDNGVKVFRYNGESINNVPWNNSNYLPNKLLQAQFVPALANIYPDRPQSPTLKDTMNSDAAASSKNASDGSTTTSSSSAATAPTKKPAGRYVPPSARGRSTGGTSLAERMRAEKESKLQGAQKVVDKPKAAISVTGKAIPGLVPATTNTGKSKSALRREREKKKKEDEEARKALEEKIAAETAAAAAEAPVDPEKRARKIKKTLKQIEELKSRDASSLNEDQQKKIASEASLREELAQLGL